MHSPNQIWVKNLYNYCKGKLINKIALHSLWISHNLQYFVLSCLFFSLLFFLEENKIKDIIDYDLFFLVSIDLFHLMKRSILLQILRWFWIGMINLAANMEILLNHNSIQLMKRNSMHFFDAITSLSLFILCLFLEGEKKRKRESNRAGKKSRSSVSSIQFEYSWRIQSE